MLSVFNDMAASVLDLLGEDAFFAGRTEPVRLNIEHGVQLTGMGGEEAAYRGDYVAQRDVVTALISSGVKVGDTYQLGSPSGPVYKLDAVVEDNGVTRRYVVLKVG